MEKSVAKWKKKKETITKLLLLQKSNKICEVEIKCLTKPAAVFCGKSLAFRGWYVSKWVPVSTCLWVMKSLIQSFHLDSLTHTIVPPATTGQGASFPRAHHVYRAVSCVCWCWCSHTLLQKKGTKERKHIEKMLI